MRLGNYIRITPGNVRLHRDTLLRYPIKYPVHNTVSAARKRAALTSDRRSANMTEPTKAKRKTRRTRSPHPNVVCIAPDKTHASFRARYRDPDTGKTVKERLVLHVDSTDRRVLERAAREACIAISHRLEARRQELMRGAPRATDMTIAEGLERFFATRARLRPKTIRCYRLVEARFLAWAKDRNLTLLSELDRPTLTQFSADLAPLPSPKQGRVTGGELDVTSLNNYRKWSRTIFGGLYDLDLLPRVRSTDDLRRAFRLSEEDTENITFLTPTTVRQTLRAALARDTNYRRRSAELIAPFVAFQLLSGARPSESLALEWPSVNWDRDEIDMLARYVKTHAARTIELSVSPMLRELLRAMYERSGGAGRIFGSLKYGAVSIARQQLVPRHRSLDGFKRPALRCPRRDRTGASCCALCQP